ncbi:hypothetical protein J2Z69_001584 [Paenibacillus shirakamiensis]|uniref:Pilus assembly protein n=1 Tax=Paenibacillus shirakamiensis TaxID=1265935 RepID=A0ABS4JFR6_9BACL|nr:TadE family protein [Paenibacillus shirakamiensis]MBP2000553.1 hypothetical protein [Paenibacillus shirakamiensis]
MNNRGSVVLEAALVMPVFVMVIFFLIYMVQVTVFSSQLHTVASNSVKNVAAHMYPVAIAMKSKDSSGSTDSTSITSWQMPKLSLSEWSSKYTEQLPSPLSDWIKEGITNGEQPLQDMRNQMSEAVLDPWLKPLLHPLLVGTQLQEERVHVSRVIVPDMKTGKSPYFGLELNYKLPIRIPFTSQPIVIQSKALERLWIGDTQEQEGGIAGEGNISQAYEGAKVLSKPSPAYRGNKATISASAKPGSRVSLTVFYKSGKSTAKYLGQATADASGYVDWSWLVSGNTTLGTWSFILETEEGVTTTDHFEVNSKQQ